MWRGVFARTATLTQALADKSNADACVVPFVNSAGEVFA